ncbi:transcription elongation factor [Mesonia aestuariivivens]|uniref:Transcription elongation factor n=1 Tax=Mesonia aestuariivivens TaxID=2796128 RepID=A0ABS6W187_9FLAO|nr:transcription elongation factor [Mesonia aestuariivivens]MBW2961606.1 transcription elongation factor [Mesonia aestuariivivens]
MKLKEQLLRLCTEYVKQRTERLEKSIRELEHDLGNEIKSSAGDKYETSREMINTEINKLQNQLQEFKKLNEVLNLIANRKPSASIQLGSIVKTNQANYFIAIPAGEIALENEKFYAIGLNSPIGKLLLGKQIGESIVFQDKKISIKEVV